MTIENVAKLIYEAMPYDGLGDKPKWIDRGNSKKQTEARGMAMGLWRHVKTGGLYQIVSTCLIEARAEVAVLYYKTPETVWCRPASEFFDGRFVHEPTPNPAPAQNVIAPVGAKERKE